MTEKEAKKIRDEFEALAKKYGIWFEVQESHKPMLTDIVLVASIKVIKK